MERRERPGRELTLLALAVGAVSAPLAAQARKLSANYALRPAGTVAEFQLSPDQSRAVYLAYATSGSFPTGGRLFSVPVDDSSPPALVSQPMIATGDVVDFRLSPDASRVAYLADQEIDGQNELFSAPLDGSLPADKLNPPLAPGEGVHLGAISSDSARVVFIVQRSVQERELYSSPLDGSAPAVRLNAALPAGGTVLGGPISPDGSRVVYTAEQEVDDVIELYVVPIDARAAPKKLSGNLVADGDVFQAPVITPDGTRVVYLADALVDGTHELFSVPIDGSAAPVKLNGPLGPGRVSSFRISPDSARVVYRANALSALTADLFSAPVDGGAAPVRIDDDASADMVDFAISADSSRVLWTVVGGSSFFSAPIATSGAAQLLSATPAVTQFSLPPAGTRAVFLGSPVFPFDPTQLFSVPVDGSSAPVLVNGPLVPGGSVRRGAAYTLDGTTALYLADQEVAGRIDLYAAPVAGLGTSLKLATGNATASPSASLLTSPTEAFFLEDYAWPEVHELQAVPLSGAAAPLQLSQLAPNRAEGDVASFALSPDLRWAVYRGDQEQVGRFALNAVRTDGSSPPRRLAPPLGPERDVEPDFRVARSRRALFRSDANTDEVFELFSAPLGGGTGPVLLNGPLVAGGDVVAFTFAPANGVVALLADARADETFELFATLADGSIAPVRVSPTLVAGGDVQPGFRFGPGGTRLLYRADQDSDETVELYRTDPAGPPQKLSAPLVSGGDVVAFETAPRGLRVAYLADQAADERFELFVTTGSAAPVELGASPTQPQRDVEHDFRFSPDGQWILFRADSVTDEQVELWRAPSGGGPALRMNGNLVGPGDVSEFRISPDGSLVAYLADQIANNAFALYSRPLDRSSPPVLLSEPPSASLPVVEFAFSPDSTWIAYARRGATTGQVSLVRADGSLAPIALPLAPGNPSGHGAFRFRPDGSSLILEDLDLGLLLVPTASPLQPLTLGGPAGSPFAVTHQDVVLQGDLDVPSAVELFALPLGTKLRGARPPP